MFICFEGIAGSGKTTQTSLLANYLEKKNKDVFVSAAYEGDRRKLVSNFMNLSGIKDDQNAVMFLFQSLHAAQHYEVNKALSSKMVVIADRWRQSFFAHHLQKNTFNGDLSLIEKLDLLAYDHLEPDIYFLLKVPPEVAYERYLKREQEMNDGGLKIMDKEYFQDVSGYYEQIARDNKWNIIDGMLNPNDISKQIQIIIDKKL